MFRYYSLDGRSSAMRSVVWSVLTSLLLIFAGCEPVTTSDKPSPGSVTGESDSAVEPVLLRAEGGTMGTSYQVTIANPPATLPEDWKEELDLVLRRINDQMSTYLKSSELTRFNDSESTDWFEVSPEVVKVVDRALEICRATDGAYDVTVGPLVDAWSFGPGKRSQQPPTDDQIEQLRQVVDYRALETRQDPPALKKSLPKLRVDLSSIAKGYGVDLLVETLAGYGCENVFVDIGGEDRAVGKRGDRPWRVAIEDPTEGVREFHLVFELDDRAIATSGDYRNFFEFEGKRYSHTIDPRTGKPVDHDVAIVSVFASDCMTADGWATALNVVGVQKALELAERHQLAIRIVERLEDGTLRATESKEFPTSVPLTPAN